jgi:phenylpropionate dioxygenase-like ring-hydroxylating dioxygenase large terminal subunit
MVVELRAGGAFLDDAGMIDRILDHVHNATTDTTRETWREPVANYWSEERLERERAVLQRLPIPFCPSAALLEPGTYFARDVTGVPLVAVRDRSGTVHVFHNACRHRATALVDGCGSARSFQCPYHGWVYRLDGTLAKVPHEEGFPDLDKSTRGLVPVDAVEHNGLIYVGQGGPIDGTMFDEAPPILGFDDKLLDVKVAEHPVNWKVAIEGFLEGYHIKYAHRESFFPYGYDNLNVIEIHGRYTRIVFPFRRLESMKDRPAEDRRIEKMAVTGTQVFPNVIFARFSRFVSMIVIEPIAVDRSRWVTFRLSKNSESALKKKDGSATDKLARDKAFSNQGGREDLDMAQRVQRGLRTRANDYVEFGHWESAIVHFHRELTRLVDGAL